MWREVFFNQSQFVVKQNQSNYALRHSLKTALTYSCWFSIRKIGWKVYRNFPSKFFLSTRGNARFNLKVEFLLPCISVLVFQSKSRGRHSVMCNDVMQDGGLRYNKLASELNRVIPVCSLATVEKSCLFVPSFPRRKETSVSKNSNLCARWFRCL